MLGILGRVFGGAKATTALISGVTKGLDALKYTAEEKAGDEAKERQAAREFLIQFMKATTGQTLARRVLAFGIFAIWGLSTVLSMAMLVVAVFLDIETAMKLKEASALIDQQIQDVDQYMLGIVAFYFAAPHVTEIFTSIANRKLSK